MAPTPCRSGEETVTKKGKTYCRKQKFYECKELKQNIKELKGLVSLLIRSKMNSHQNKFIPKEINIPKHINIPKPPRPPPPPPKPSAAILNKPNLTKRKGLNAVLAELKTKIKAKN